MHDDALWHRKLTLLVLLEPTSTTRALLPVWATLCAPVSASGNLPTPPHGFQMSSLVRLSTSLMIERAYMLISRVLRYWRCSHLRRRISAEVDLLLHPTGVEGRKEDCQPVSRCQNLDEASLKGEDRRNSKRMSLKQIHAKLPVTLVYILRERTEIETMYHRISVDT